MNTFPDGKVLRINLTEGTFETEMIPGEIYRQYPGGSALALYLIMKEMNPETEPYAPEALLVFAVSPLTGLPFSGNSRVVVAAKSPLTGTIGDSQGGGFFPAHLKANGFDALVFKGISPRPVYLHIDGDEITLKCAEHLWGKNMPTADVEDAICQELDDDKVEIAQIGAAGENKVRFACILSRATRANGRNGMGAVMGSKNLKAIVVKRKPVRKPVDKEAFDIFAKGAKSAIEQNGTIDGLGQYGTAGDTEAFHDIGFLPTRNWQTGCFPEGAKNITGTTMYDTVLKKRDTCFACVVSCKRVVDIPERGIQPRYGGPEYETVATFGSYCAVGDLADVCLANQLCNMYGMDTISAGATIAFAMECYEKGLLSPDIVEGLDLSFGNGKVFEVLLPQIAARSTKLGDLLAEGSARAAKAVGNGAEEFFMGVKNQEFPAHMPQFKPAVGIVYAVNPFGADHQSSEHDTALTSGSDSMEYERLSMLGIKDCRDDSFDVDSEKARFALETQRFFSILDTLCLCQFTWGPSWELYGPQEMLDVLKHGIGVEMTLEELMEAGERRINMMRWFNAKNGFDKKDDRLPKRIFKSLPDGPFKDRPLDPEAFQKAIDSYYEHAGWDPETGNPTEETLNKLSLSWLIK